MIVNRREWIKNTSLAVSAAVLPSSGETADRVGSLKGRIYKSVKGGQKKGESVEAFFLRLKALGFDGVESGNHHHAADYFAATKKTGIMVHGLVGGWHWHTRLSSADPEVRKKAAKLLEQSIRNVRTLGGSSLLLVPGKVTGANETHDHVWNRSVEIIEDSLPLASQLGVRILVETVWNGFCESPEKFREYIDVFNSPWLGAYFDIGNMQKFAPAEEWIRTLGDRTVKLDIKDWGKKRGFCRLGEGDVNWEKVREALNDVGFNGWATREGRDKDLQDTSSLIDELLIG